MKSSTGNRVEHKFFANYELLDKIGQGTSGTVCKARDKDGNVVALKVLHPRLASDRVAVERFLREARVAMQLHHPNLVRALEVGTHGGLHFLAMEFIDGENLAVKLERERCLSQADAVRITLDLADVLQLAHEKNLVHRDIKPANVLIACDGRPKLADMGLVKEIAGAELTRPNQGMGTPIYMAPEQFLDAQKADFRCDIYSLGVMLFVMATGEVPFPGPNVTQILDRKMRNDYVSPLAVKPNLHPDLAAAIQQAIDANPAIRPASMRAFAGMIRAAVPHPTPHAIAVSLVGVGDTAQMNAGDTAIPNADPDPIWFLVLPRKADGKLMLVRSTESAVREAIGGGKLSARYGASLDMAGPFTPLGRQPTFETLFPKRRTANASRNGGVTAK